MSVAFIRNVAFVTRLKKNLKKQNKDASLETTVCFLTVVTMEKSLSMLLILRTENCTGHHMYHSCLFFKIRSNLICFKKNMRDDGALSHVGIDVKPPLLLL